MRTNRLTSDCIAATSNGMNNQNIKNKKWLILLALLFFFGFFTANQAEAATLYFSPSSGNYTVGNIFTVNVLVNTESVAINNAEAIVNFPADFLEIVSLDKSGTIFSFWVPTDPTFSNSAGTLTFNGGLPTPGYTGTGKILSAVFRVRKAGSATLIFSSAAVRANDGYGTNVLRATSGASFNLQQPVASPPPEAPIVASGFEISSSTHPDQNRWYSNNDPIFQIKFPSDARELNLTLSRDHRSTPLIKYTPPISEKFFKDVDEGVWYLRANYRGESSLSQTITYKIQVDTTPPKEFNIIAIEDNPEEPKIIFETTDELSGIDHYEIKIDDEDWVAVDKELAGKEYALNDKPHGRQLVTVKAVDGAGNSTIASTTILLPGGIFDKLINIIKSLFRGWFFPAIIVALIALAHEFFSHSNLGKKLRNIWKNKRKITLWT